MKILVLSCDIYEDTFEAFHHCMEKYWSDHPQIIYQTETVQNPYYKTINANYPLSQWSRGVREVLKQIKDKQILLMVCDCFIRKPVDVERFKYACKNLKGNIACINFEKSFDYNDEETDLIGFKKRRRGSDFEVSIMCGLWDREKLLNVLSVDGDPWYMERIQNHCGYDYLINSGDYIIDWGYITHKGFGISNQLWYKETVDFLESEGIHVDLTKRGVRP